MKKVGPVVENILKKHNLWKGYQQYLVVVHWEELVGAELAEVTRADSISRGVLQVLVKDSVWSYHLSMLKPGLIKKLNEKAGRGVVQEIFFKIGPLEKKDN